MRGVKTRAGNKWKKLGVFLILILLFIVLLNSVNNVYKKKKGAEEVLSRMQGEVKVLTEREEYLKESLERLATTEGIKFEIRKKLNVAEVGESVAIIVTEEKDSSTKLLKTSPWQKFKNFWTELFR